MNNEIVDKLDTWELSPIVSRKKLNAEVMTSAGVTSSLIKTIFLNTRDMN